MNDPNGLVYHEGRYHLFYQHEWPRTWGHASSADLLAWKHHSVAIPAVPAGDAWSGSVVVDEGNDSGLVPGGGLIAVYTLYREGTQRQGLAGSVDGGETWTVNPAGPVLESEGRPDFRDPKAFRHPEGGWALILSEGDRLGFYASPDLRRWRRTGEFGLGVLPEGAVYECPDLFPMALDGGEPRWVLLTSWLTTAMFKDPERRGESGTLAFVGDFDGSAFLTEGAPQVFSAGPDDYAPITWEAPDGGRIAIGWMSDWSYAERLGGSEWQGQMTLPRRLSLESTPAGIRLRQRLPDGLGVEVTSLKPGEVYRHQTPLGTVTVTSRSIDRSALDVPALGARFSRRVEADVPEGTALVVVDRASIEVFREDGAAYLSAVLPFSETL